MSKSVVVQFVKAGANLQEGIRLFAKYYGKDHPFLRLARSGSSQAHSILVTTLCRQFNVPLSPSGESAKREGGMSPSPRGWPKAGGGFRHEFPFLSSPDCPQELKILAADKLTAFHTYRSLHPKLFECNTPEEELTTVSRLVEAFIENRAIYDELQYYKKHKSILGRHRIFNEYNELKALQKLDPISLAEKRKKLQHNIWRIQSQLQENDKPHLKADRENRLAQKQRLLQEVERLITLTRKRT